MSDAQVNLATPNCSALDLVIYGGDLTEAHTGVAVYVRSLLRALEKKPATLRWAVAVPETRSACIADLPPEHRLIVPGRDVRGFLWNEVVWQTRTARWVKQHAGNAVFHTPFHFWSPVTPERMMMTAHDCIEMRVPEVRQPGRVRRLHRSLCWRLVRHSAQVIAVSDWTRQDLVHLARIPSQRITVIHNWPGRTYRRNHSADEIAAMRASYQLPPHYIAYLGGFRSYKNLATLIEAHRNAQPRGCPPLVLGGSLPPAGSGKFYTDVRAIAANGVSQGTVVLPGAIREEDLPLFYAGASLFVSPSLYEGFGYPAVEASACGTPVLVADRSAYREIFPEHIRFPADDPAALAEKIIAALNEPASYVHSLDERLTEERGKRAYEDIVRSLLAK